MQAMKGLCSKGAYASAANYKGFRWSLSGEGSRDRQYVELGRSAVTDCNFFSLLFFFTSGTGGRQGDSTPKMPRRESRHEGGKRLKTHFNKPLKLFKSTKILIQIG